MTESFTNLMLLLNDYYFVAHTIIYFSFYHMTEYSSNLILLLNDYFCCVLVQAIRN